MGPSSLLLPVKLFFVTLIETQKEHVDRKPHEPPAGLQSPVLGVASQRQNFQPKLCKIVPGQEAAEGQWQNIPCPAPVKKGWERNLMMVELENQIGLWGMGNNCTEAVHDLLW